MRPLSANRIILTVTVLLVASMSFCARAAENTATFNVKSYGATGKKADSAQKAIQSAIDDCAKAGGGRVVRFQDITYFAIVLRMTAAQR